MHPVRGDITTVTVDAIVNAANTSLLGGGGVDGAIHRAGGSEILDACRDIVARQGGCKTGDAVITTAGRLQAKFVIHTGGPVWQGGGKNEDALLKSCYQKSLELAVTHACRTIALPGISTGVYRFPKDRATEIAVETVALFIRKNSMIEQVLFVCFDDEYFELITNHLKKYSDIF